MRKEIALIRDVQYKRNGKLNKSLSSSEVQGQGGLSDQAKHTLQQFAEKIKLSPRVYLRTIKVARTIADLDTSENIEEKHILEALQYRPKFE